MAYIGAEPDGMGKAQRFTFTASGGETVVSVDNDGIPIGYTSGQVSVFLNGVKLVVGTDCIATNGSTITGLAALAASDVVEVVALSIFSATTVEGTDIISTGVTGTSKYLRVDGDGTSSWQTVTEYNDDVVQTNIALLGFKVAVNGSLAKYDLQDQIVDEYKTEAGVNLPDSTNESYTTGEYYSGGSSLTPTVTQDADATGTDGDYTWYKWTDTGATGSFNSDTTQDLAWVVVGGGGGGGQNRGAGGGGAGGFRTGTALTLTASTAYTMTIGAGGNGISTTGSTGSNSGTDSSIAGSDITNIVADGGGGGGSGADATSGPGKDGGSGGGAGNSVGTSYGKGDDEAITQLTAHGETTTVQGYDGGTSTGDAGTTGSEAGGGGGGAIAVGASTTTSGVAGVGGIGSKEIMGMTDANSTLVLAATSAGHSSGSYRYLAGGGGGAANGATCGAGGLGGGSAGKSSSGDATDATDGTGGGGGGHAGQSASGSSGDGGNGIIILRRLTNIENIDNLILQSSDTTAEAAPTKADMVMLVEDAGSGVGTVNTHIKGWISMYETGGTKTWTQGTLVDEGDWGSDKRILAFHDLTLTGTSGTQMAYKITTHSASAVYDTRIHATSIGWR